MPTQRRKSSGGGRGRGRDAGPDKENEGVKPRRPPVKPRISVEELRQQYRRQASVHQEDQMKIEDPLEKALASLKVVRGVTGVVYEERMVEHLCLWDDKHTETPERFSSIITRCRELGLLTRCERVPQRQATNEELLSLHCRAHINLLEMTSGEGNEDKLEKLASAYDSIYFHPTTYELAKYAAGCTIDIVDSVLKGKIQNGMAIVRPPGHHAMGDEFCGYCYFNNVAVAAKHALEKCGTKRILIVDWDVHHGQATQRAFYNDPRVLYFSIHRYEHGLFWPELRESEFDFVGADKGKGFNFNVPLNQKGMGNADYLAIFHQVLMPVAYEYDPELVLVSAGYDSALADTKGEMCLTPAFYSHLTRNLMNLAQGKVAVVLEGGYNVESLSEGASLTLRTLLGDPSPYLIEPVGKPTQSIQETLLNLIYVQRPYWQCFQHQGTYSTLSGEPLDYDANPRHLPIIQFKGKTTRQEVFETRGSCDTIIAENDWKNAADLLHNLKKDTKLDFAKKKLSLVYEESMTKHKSIDDPSHPECPARIQEIWAKLTEYGIVDRALKVNPRRATYQELEYVHHPAHFEAMKKINTMDETTLLHLESRYNSIYLNPFTNDCALLAAGSLLEVVSSVCKEETLSGIAVIRPPGHHAEPNEAHGFCIYNNVAIAARHAIQKHGLERVLIFDWDIHHGNGIQHMFDADPRVLYISLHRYDFGLFFPSSEDGNFDAVGHGPGEGYNVNLAWNKARMGDPEYMAAMLQVVMPIAYQFNPQLVLVSAGFDAARGDPLGGYLVSPECYGHMTALLSTLAGGKVVIALEGGYNLTSISYSMVMCAKALLGDPLPALEPGLVPNKQAVKCIKNVINVQKKYWSSLAFQVDLPLEDVLNKSRVESVTENKSCTSLSTSEVSSSPSTPAPTTPSPSTPATSPSDSLNSSSPYYSATSSPEKPPLCTESTQTQANLALLTSEIENMTLNQESYPPKTPDISGRGREWPVARNKETFNEVLKPSLLSQKNVIGPTAFITSSDSSLSSCLKRIKDMKIFDDCIRSIPSSTENQSLEPKRLAEELFKNVKSQEVQNGLILLNQATENADKNNLLPLIEDVLRSYDVTERILLLDWNTNKDSYREVSSRPRLLRFSLFAEVDSNQDDIRPTPTDGYSFDLGKCTSEADYLSIFHQVILPVAYEFSPEVIVVSGSCAAIKSNLSDLGLLAHLLSLMLPLAGGRCIVMTEACKQTGGTEGVVSTILGTLKHLYVGYLNSNTFDCSRMTDNVSKKIQQIVVSHKVFWKCFGLHAAFSIKPESSNPVISSCKTANWSLSSRRSSGALPNLEVKKTSVEPESLELSLCNASKKNRVSIVFDLSMTKHINLENASHPECPQRIVRIMETLENYDLVERCTQLQSRLATQGELERVHSKEYLSILSGVSGCGLKDLIDLELKHKYVYFHEATYNSASFAAGSTLQVIESICRSESKSGVCVVRPPGHRAEPGTPMGFCYLNNVAIAAKHAIEVHNLERVMIFDWGIHHGNGTQTVFESDPRVLYISIHHYDGKVFPAHEDADYDKVGKNEGMGFNVNIPWSQTAFGDTEYMAAMHHIVLPIASQFNPQLVLVSAGFDAAVGDPLGRFNVTPQCFGHMTSLLRSLAGGRMALILEGGYNLHVIQYCMAMCVKALLGDPLPPLDCASEIHSSALESLRKVVDKQKSYWPILKYKCHNEHNVDEISKTEAGLSLGHSSCTSLDACLSSSFESLSMSVSTQTLVNLENSTATAKESKKVAHAVVPLSWCEHLGSIAAIPVKGIDTAAKCEDCNDERENWLCLHCYKVLCSRYVHEHMVLHSAAEKHNLTMSFSDLSVWCYACDSYLDNQMLFEIKKASYKDKFGEDIPVKK